MRAARTGPAVPALKKCDSMNRYEVGGRGELQMGVLSETMRREGFDLSISRPRVL